MYVNICEHLPILYPKLQSLRSGLQMTTEWASDSLNISPRARWVSVPLGRTRLGGPGTAGELYYDTRARAGPPADSAEPEREYRKEDSM